MNYFMNFKSLPLITNYLTPITFMKNNQILFSNSFDILIQILKPESFKKNFFKVKIFTQAFAQKNKKFLFFFENKLKKIQNKKILKLIKYYTKYSKN